jgi:acyl carrier protein
MDSKKLIINDIETLISVICDMQIPFDEICENLCSLKWDPNANTFYDMDMDDLDVIAAVIEIEKKYEIIISDFVVDKVLSIKPNSLISVMKREQRLRQIGI